MDKEARMPAGVQATRLHADMVSVLGELSSEMNVGIRAETVNLSRFFSQFPGTEGDSVRLFFHNGERGTQQEFSFVVDGTECKVKFAMAQHNPNLFEEGVETQLRIPVGGGESTDLIGVYGGTQIMFGADLNNLFTHPEYIEGDVTAKDLAKHILKSALSGIMDSIENRGREEFADTLMTMYRASVALWRETITNNDASIDNHLRQLSELYTRNQATRAQINAFDGTMQTARDKAKEEYEKLVRLVGTSLEEVQVVNRRLQLRTSEMHIEYDGIDYNIGRIVIDTPILGNSGEVTMFSYDGRDQNGCAHPHVSGGRVCWGNVGGTITEALSTGEVLQAVLAMLAYLQSYNSEDAYTDIQNWGDAYDRNQACREDHSTDECARCDSEECPYREESRQECFDDHTRDECIRCNSCPLANEAAENCLRELLSTNTLGRCMETCTVNTCRFFRNPVRCRNVIGSCPTACTADTSCYRHPSYSSGDPGGGGSSEISVSRNMSITGSGDQFDIVRRA